MFWHRLAFELGDTVEGLQERMSSAEFTRWIAFARLEPFGYEMQNYRMGTIAATVANVAPRKKGAKPLRPQAFYPDISKHVEMTPRQRKELAERKRRKAQK